MAAHDEYLAIEQRHRSSALARLRHRWPRDNRQRLWIEDLGRGERAIGISAADDGHASIGQSRGGVSLAGRTESAGRIHGPGDAVVHFDRTHGKTVTLAADDDNAIV